MRVSSIPALGVVRGDEADLVRVRVRVGVKVKGRVGGRG